MVIKKGQLKLTFLLASIHQRNEKHMKQNISKDIILNGHSNINPPNSTPSLANLEAKNVAGPDPTDRP